jgi:hypothetical protein
MIIKLHFWKTEIFKTRLRLLNNSDLSKELCYICKYMFPVSFKHGGICHRKEKLPDLLILKGQTEK